MSEDKKITVTRTIDATPKDIFAVISNPARHAELDASGMIVSDEKTDRITANGQTFRMNMRNDMFGDYQMDNHVQGYAENRLISWAPGKTDVNDGQAGGWTFTYVLEPQGPDSTDVTLTYDWSQVTDKQLLRVVSFPVVSESELADSLARLASAVSGG